MVMAGQGDLLDELAATTKHCPHCNATVTEPTMQGYDFWNWEHLHSVTGPGECKQMRHYRNAYLGLVSGLARWDHWYELHPPGTPEYAAAKASYTADKDCAAATCRRLYRKIGTPWMDN